MHTELNTDALMHFKQMHQAYFQVSHPIGCDEQALISQIGHGYELVANYVNRCSQDVCTPACRAFVSVVKPAINENLDGEADFKRLHAAVHQSPELVDLVEINATDIRRGEQRVLFILFSQIQER